MTEAVLQRLILGRLVILPRVYAWRANTGAARTPDGFVRFGVPGQADILGVAAGRFFAVEVKSAKGTLREAQKLFRDRVEGAGGLYVVAKTLDQALEPINKILGEA